MTKSFKARIWRLVRWATLTFCILFIFRFIYGYLATDTRQTGDYTVDFFESISDLRKNYASEKVKFQQQGNSGGLPQAAGGAAPSQKYEKTASVRAKSSHFEDDAKQIAAKTEAFKAIVQYEQALGLKGGRELHLLIGVNPEAFDSFYLAIQKVGVIKSTQITKVDKTNEYRQLNAQKASLQKTLESLNELKSKPGPITDLVALHDKILETEGKLQDLGVELGNFDTENEFCTVRISLYEGATEKKQISLIHRVRVALEWTIHYFTYLAFATVAVLCGAFVLLVIVDKLKLINKIARKLEE
ncbi:DUF4349 domain-containing protein [Chitinophaga rhizophila]|uniref:DUF4349 domain-containing protein n=1 Tax=Chitinophaga rhizophila TaxID=2866212 RepID=A0ABS7GJN2_9BACT|nr:DUF4349 domain-containing protein [Chitinophaga rhizophila]MBW8686668.1 DUF4349 domain-containing protein [Chitinophaga rhizophila]